MKHVAALRFQQNLNSMLALKLGEWCRNGAEHSDATCVPFENFSGVVRVGREFVEIVSLEKDLCEMTRGRIAESLARFELKAVKLLFLTLLCVFGGLLRQIGPVILGLSE